MIYIGVCGAFFAWISIFLGPSFATDCKPQLSYVALFVQPERCAPSLESRKGIIQYQDGGGPFETIKL